MVDRALSVGRNLRKVNSKDFDYLKMETLLEEGYLKSNRGVSQKRKRSFAPSSIGYGHGTCFSGETEFVTDQGIRTMADAVGEEVVVWTGHGRWGQGRDKSWSTSRGWKAATVESFGVHPLMKITAERNGVTREIYATESHRWIVETSKHPRDEKRGCAVRKTTSELEPGWRLWRDANFTLNSPRWKVVSVEKTDRVEEVFCVVEPETERFALADGILTMNCPRRWYLAFAGAEFDESADALGVANMANGSATHDRLQRIFKDMEIAVEIEKEMKVERPPIRAFIDVIAEVDGIKAVVEIKSTREESFVHRRYKNAPMPYHLYQLLMYMYFEGIDQGALLYENKNDNTILTLPVRMNDFTRKIAEECIEWLNLVWDNWKQDAEYDEPEVKPEIMDANEDWYVGSTYEHLPKRPFGKRSKECKSCPVFNECWNIQGDGTVVLPPMEVVEL